VKEDTVTQADPATRPQLTINITIDGRHYAVHEQSLTGAQVLALAGLPPADQLFRRGWIWTPRRSYAGVPSRGAWRRGRSAR